jgi:pyruvate,orthophosphate dikinase
LVTYVFDFDHPHETPPRELKGLLGGKGANLAEMTSVLALPVPPGFTISTEACRAYREKGWPEGLDEEVAAALARLEKRVGRRLGDPVDPMLVSVRSGAASSMPGMMDTVLDLGLTDASIEGLAAVTGDRAFAQDSYNRFRELYARIVLDDESAESVPQDPKEQLRAAVEAVFRSWDSPRAKAYRKREHIADDLGTAVNVQAMVFGNRDELSGTGVGFTRDPSTGEAVPYGDFLVNAQGEDVVAGIRQTLPLAAMGERFPAAYAELLDIFQRLELHFRDMLDTEFTIEHGRLWMLQVRVGKRTGRAALRIAVDMANEERIGLTPAEAVQRVSADHLDQMLHRQLDKRDLPVLTTGLGASPGAAVGRVHLTPEACVAAHAEGEAVILVREETSPEDVHGMEVAEGVLTARGGLVSHAAVVARGWGKPAVVGAAQVEVLEDGFRVGETLVHEGDVISLDGTTGEVILGEARTVESGRPAQLDVVLGWADEIRAGRLGVRANADVGQDAAVAREFGAEGIGLCRTEHMFLGDRLPLVRRMILAQSPEEEHAALDELGAQQQADFVELLEVMDGLPVTVRLLDPPLHEFLPDVEDLIVQEANGALDTEAGELFAAAREWREENPMLGTRGVRLGILKGGLFQMQARALAAAAQTRRAAGGDPRFAIMIPLVATAAELELVRRWIEEALDEELGADRDPVPIGTMIEIPRAAIRADDIAEHADFFSFGTNDLTQMTFGFSRDDVERRLMPRYLEEGLLPRNPFEVIDFRGVGELVRMGAERGRATNPDLELGVCGEHGGDPASIAFFAEVGLNYVSCSPYRVPVARLAAAQALLALSEARLR